MASPSSARSASAARAAVIATVEGRARAVGASPARPARGQGDADRVAEAARDAVQLRGAPALLNVQGAGPLHVACAGGTAGRAHHGARGHPPLAPASGDEAVHQPLADARFLPAGEPRVDAAPPAELGRPDLPRCAGAGDLGCSATTTVTGVDSLGGRW
ncbi:MAG: hypothetical protein ACLFTG_15530, partial [Alphaproteobacteria bacterium]